MEIMRVGADELPEIERIAYQTWPDTYGNILSAEQLEYMLNRFYNVETLHERLEAGSLFHIIRENDSILGFSEIRCNEKEKLCKLHKLYVLPETQGKSIGKLLLNHAFELAQQAGQKGIFLNVNRFNKAKSFYEKLGFALVAEEDVDIGQGFYMNDYVMQLNFE